MQSGLSFYSGRRTGVYFEYTHEFSGGEAVSQSKEKEVCKTGLSGMFHSLCGGCDSGCAGGCIAGGGNNFFQYQQEYRSLSSKTAEMGNRYVP